MNNEELIMGLRSKKVDGGSFICMNCSTQGCAIMREAADTIETLTKQLAALQAKYDEVNDFERSQCHHLLKQLSEVTSQRDAAVADLKCNWLCGACRKQVPGHEWTHCDERHFIRLKEGAITCGHFEWRGQKEVVSQ